MQPHRPLSALLSKMPLLGFVTFLTFAIVSLTVQPASADAIDCSQTALNAAIVASNSSSAPIELPSGCTITLDGTLNSGSVYDGPGPTALAPITGTVTIFTASGETPATITRDSADPFRIFSVQGGTLTLSNVVISGGLAKGGSGGNGGIYVDDLESGLDGSGAGGGGGMGGNGGNGGTGPSLAGGGGGGSIGDGADGDNGGAGGIGFDTNGTGGNNGGRGGIGREAGSGAAGNGGFGGGSGGKTEGYAPNSYTGKAGFGGGAGGRPPLCFQSQCENNRGFGGGVGGGSNGSDDYGGGGGGGGAGMGGAIFVYSGTLNTFATTFSNNKAVGGKGGNGLHTNLDTTGGGGGNAYGGAIFSGGTYCDGGGNVFSGNTALGGAGGENGPIVTTYSPAIPPHGTPETETASERFDNPGDNGLTAGTTTSACAVPSIDGPDVLPHGAIDNAYSQTVTASDGVPPYTFAVTSGALPGTLTLDPDTGILSGTPSAMASMALTITVTDFLGHTGTKDYTLTIDDIAVNPSKLPIARLGKPYSQVISASGGTAPYTLSTAETPPDGLTFDPSTGLLSGIPTLLGDFPFTVEAEDDNGLTGSQVYVIKVRNLEPKSPGNDKKSNSGQSDTSGALCASPNGSNSFVRATVPDGAARLDGHSASVYCTPLTVADQYGGPFDQPVQHAVEVFALTDSQPSRSVTTFSAPVTICLQGQGRLLFRDANSGGQGRTTVELSAFAQGEFTCAAVPNAGTVLLLDGPSSLPPAPPDISANLLSTCTVTTTARLNLRAAPDLGADVLDLVPYQTQIKATTRQGDFVQVVFGNHQGWLSAQYLTLDGDCGP